MGYSLLAVAGMSFAQAVHGQAFDVVSVRPSSVQDFSGRSVQNLSGGIRFIGMPLSTIIMPAYEVWDFQISGPDWIRTEPWDIVAKTEAVQGFLKIEQLRPMLRALLEDRFQLKVHREKQLMPGYALVVDKRGPKLQPNNGANRLIQNGRGSLVARKEGMFWLAGWLSQMLGRVVADETGLSEEFDFSLKWSPGPGENSTTFQTPTTPSDSDGPSIFTALKEQLGLRLDSQKAPTEVIVIDGVQRPSPN